MANRYSRPLSYFSWRALFVTDDLAERWDCPIYVVRIVFDFAYGSDWTSKVLMAAVDCGCTEDTRTLLLQGANPNYPHKGLGKQSRRRYSRRHGTDPLIYMAARRNHVAMVRVLLDFKADPNVTTERQTTPLHWAAEEGFLEVARLLVERGADCNRLDAEGTTPLHRAVQRGREGAVRILLEQGKADPRIAWGQSMPLDMAIQRGFREISRLLEVRLRDHRETCEVTRLLSTQVLPSKGELPESTGFSSFWVFDKKLASAGFYPLHPPAQPAVEKSKAERLQQAVKAADAWMIRQNKRNQAHLMWRGASARRHKERTHVPMYQHFPRRESSRPATVEPLGRWHTSQMVQPV